VPRLFSERQRLSALCFAGLYSVVWCNAKLYALFSGCHRDFCVCRASYKRRSVDSVSRILFVKDRQSIRDAVETLVHPAEKILPRAAARILIAEDRESMRDALKHLFKLRKNWEVCGEAQDGKEAARKAEELHPDLIVMDYKMQDTDGLEAADRIFKVLPDVPVVMFTLYKTDELERAARKIGVRCVVGKEEGVHTLLHAIESQLPNSMN
jgi:CheY-like chemotaxis protein